MKIGIIGAMAEEVIVLKEAMNNMSTWNEAGNAFFEGTIGDKEVVVVQSGIGKVMSAMTATLLIHRYQVDVLLNTGSAGGIGTGLRVGDIVISSKLAYNDVDVTAFGYAKGQMAGMPLYYEADEQVVTVLEQATQNQGMTSKRGLITTSDSFIASQEKIDTIKTDFPDVLATEMEGAAIAQVATQYNVPFAVVRAISDVADEEASMSFDDFIIEAGKKSALVVIEFINHYKK
ncbi:5'-methylthioadenosine/adenosylhomocysteine nucleosidase [Vagococcus xieshaowenii]|uniref:5'-methylthioadenosine/S-adenosylhomocysteine nucleosidase n=1 Tax=Vagococcus xieshaowenii TaxID=2562451 RepID=A0AAJ5EHI3_9ENTE|nr:5'-methylthioadenosine/adenosylhomocysteine nucleosidase [Vagococcus xieshaowenii]QCA28911.1 5'-methylthioadenosine/adenosylhomocysteine nucleosidase [Vagococcus xieshaowenii]TFZ43329.1 5'-methylthioadenosine/adenosylhomocysteine nucleosidase [Vagococcus xieshaowenii]